MSKNLLFAMLLCLLATTANAQTACVWPAYENTVRIWGEAVDVNVSLAGDSWVDVKNYSGGGYMRIDCGLNAAARGCASVATGDSILVSGHAESAPLLPFNGVNTLVANVVYRCQGHVAGTCIQLTPCL